MKKSIIVIFLLIASLSSCQQKTADGSSIGGNMLNIDSDKAIDLEAINIQSDTLHLQGAMLPGTILRCQLVNDSLYILDPIKARGLFVFNTEGIFLTTIGKIGPGPEELMDFTDFDVNESEILILDNISRKINTYSKNGEYICSIPTEPMTMNIASDRDGGLWLDRGNVTTFKSDSLHWKLSYQTLEDRNIMLPVPTMLDGITISPRSNFNKYDNSVIAYMPSMEPVIHTLKDGKITESLAINFGKYWPDDDFFEKYSKTDIYTIVNTLSSEDYVMNLSFVENKEWIVIDFSIKDNYFISITKKDKSKNYLIKSNKDNAIGYPILLNDDDMWVATPDDGIIRIFNLKNLN